MSESRNHGRKSNETTAEVEDSAEDHPPIPRPRVAPAPTVQHGSLLPLSPPKKTARAASLTSTRSSFTCSDYNDVLKGIPAHARPFTDVADLYETSHTRGLEQQEADARLVSFGENIFKADAGPSALKVLIRQMVNGKVPDFVFDPLFTLYLQP